MSQEYAAALAIMVVSILKMVGIQIANDVMQGLIVGLAALWIAFRRHQKGDITVAGLRK